MKQIFFFLVAVLFSAALFASTSESDSVGFYYQAVVRSADGALLSESDLTIRISLYPGRSATLPSYSETHDVHTDRFASFSIMVGAGIRDANCIAANYADVNFEAVHYWLKIEVLEGSSYRELSFSILPVMPYTKHALNGVPTGTIMSFAGSLDRIPAGYLLCDGRELNRNTYANLYRAIGVDWGSGDGVTTFNIPECRGLFLRGAACGDTIYNRDAPNRIPIRDGGNNGATNGTFEDNAMIKLTGTIDGGGDDGPLPAGGYGTGVFEVGPQRGNGASGSNASGAHSFNFDSSRQVPAGSDLRPKNVSVVFIIKY